MSIVCVIIIKYSDTVVSIDCESRLWLWIWVQVPVKSWVIYYLHMRCFTPFEFICTILKTWKVNNNGGVAFSEVAGSKSTTVQK